MALLWFDALPIRNGSLFFRAFFWLSNDGLHCHWPFRSRNSDIFNFGRNDRSSVWQSLFQKHELLAFSPALELYPGRLDHIDWARLLRARSVFLSGKAESSLAMSTIQAKALQLTRCRNNYKHNRSPDSKDGRTQVASLRMA